MNKLHMFCSYFGRNVKLNESIYVLLYWHWIKWLCVIWKRSLTVMNPQINITQLCSFMELFCLFRLIVLLLLYGWVTVFSSNQFPAAAGSCFQQTSYDKLTQTSRPAKPNNRQMKLATGWCRKLNIWATRDKIYPPYKYYFFDFLYCKFTHPLHLHFIKLKTTSVCQFKTIIADKGNNIGRHWKLQKSHYGLQR